MSIPRDMKDQAKAAPIVQLAERLGIQVKNGKALCFIHDEKTPSLSFDQTTNRYKCFGCGAGGDTIELVMKYTGKGFADAVSFILGREISAIQGTETKGREKGHPPAGGHRVGANRAYPEKTAENTPENIGEYGHIYTRLIELSDAGKAVSYLQGRGIDKAITERARIRVTGEAAAVALKNEYPMDVLKASGIFADSKSTGSEYFAFYRHRLLIPYYGADGNIITVQGRNIDNDEPPKYRLLANGRGTALYNLHALKGDTVYLCEGAIDALSCEMLGLTPALAVAGVNNFKAEYYDLLSPYRLIIASDTDKAGKAFYRTMRKEYLRRGKGDVHPLNFAELCADCGITEAVKDINDIVQRADMKHYRAMITPKRYYSSAVNDTFIPADGGAVFDSGVKYTAREIEIMHGADAEAKRRIHEIKKVFSGTVIQ